MRVAFPLVKVLGTVAALTLAGCSASKVRIPPAPIDLSQQLAEADALVAAGCFDCLRDALQKYQTLRLVSEAAQPARARATAGAFRTAALLALRQRELGMIDDGYLQAARELRTSLSCSDEALTCESLDRLLDIIGILPFDSSARPPASDAQMADAQRLYRNREVWMSLLRDAAGRDLLAAYAWLAFACGPAGAGSRDDVLAPLGALRDVPLLVFKQATCSSRGPDTLQALLSGDSRFIEISYPLGL